MLNVNRDADSWVQFDPSYKQYDYQQGLDVAAISGIDGQTLADSFLASGSVNETEGWVQGFDPTIIQNAQTQAQTALQDHITNQMTNPTVGDVIGGRKTIVKQYPGVPSSLPNAIVIEGARYGELPDGLRSHMTFAFGRDSLGYPINPTSLPWATLNNARITLSFKPATAADEAALLALLPQGQITDIAQLPSSIPAYLISVIPELKLNGAVIKSGQPMRLGNELDLIYQVITPLETMAPYTYKVAAGAYLALAAIGESVGPQQLSDLQTKLTATHTDPISVPGYTGAGYIIIDPDTGIGAYKIGGGMNGAFITFAIFAIAMIIAIVMLLNGALLLGGFLLLWEVFGFASWIAGMKSADSWESFNQNNAGSALIGLLGLLPLAEFGGAVTSIVKWFGMIFGSMLTNPFGWFY